MFDFFDVAFTVFKLVLVDLKTGPAFFSEQRRLAEL